MQRFGLQAAYPPSQLPPNEALEQLAAGLAAAWREAGSVGSLLFVVQPGERNVFDQQWLQAQLWEAHGVRTLRRSLAETAAQGRLDERGLLCVGDTQLSVVYFRAGCAAADVDCAGAMCV